MQGCVSVFTKCSADFANDQGVRMSITPRKKIGGCELLHSPPDTGEPRIEPSSSSYQGGRTFRRPERAELVMRSGWRLFSADGCDEDLLVPRDLLCGASWLSLLPMAALDAKDRQLSPTVDLGNAETRTLISSFATVTHPSLSRWG